MKRMLLVIIALFIILGLSLVAYNGGTLREAMASPTPTGDHQVVGAKTFRDVTLSSMPAKDPVTSEKIFEGVAVTPIPYEDKIFRDVISTPTPAGDPVIGEKLFTNACRVCHGKDMIHNEFIASSTDQELVEFIKVGGVPNQPLVMLPKGGKPSLTDEKLYNIVAYLRNLQK